MSNSSDRIPSVVGDKNVKNPVAVAAVTNITLTGEQTIDGVTTAGSRVLLTGQTDTTTNGIYCVDPLTEIMTKRGFKCYDQVIPGEEVFTLNLDTGLSEWQPAISVHFFPVENIDVLSMETGAHSSLSTLNHRWPVSRRYPPADRFPRQRQVNGSFAPWAQPIDAPFLAIRESHELTSEDYLLLSAKCSNLPQEKSFDDAMVELLGWFITEGHIRKNNSGSPSSVVKISQSLAVNPEKVERIRDCLRTLWGQPTELLRRKITGERQPEWHERVASKGRMAVFTLNSVAGAQLCELAPNRVVRPEVISALTESQLLLFVDACIAADGYTGKVSTLYGTKHRCFDQKREAMLAPVQMACALAGISTNTTMQQGLFRMTLTTRDRVLPQRQAKVEKYSGIVWCPKTKNSTWLARRNGSLYFTGNTSDTGTWTRDVDCNGQRQLANGTLVYAVNGTSNRGFWYCTATDPVVADGSMAITFAKASTVLAVISAYGQNLIQALNAAAARVVLGVGAFGDTLFTSATVAAARTLLGMGTAALLNAGTAALNLLQLDASAKIPAVDGSQITSLAFFTRAYNGLLAINNAGTPNTKIDIAAGKCRDSTDAVNMISAGYTIDCGTVGANGLDVGSLGTNEWNQTWLISKADGTTAAIATKASAGPALPSGYIYKRRIKAGMFKTDGSNHFIARKPYGGRGFIWDASVKEIDAGLGATTAIAQTLGSAPSTLGIQTTAQMIVALGNGGSVGYALVTSTDQTDAAAGSSNYTLNGHGAATYIANTEIRRKISATGVIRLRADNAVNVFTLQVVAIFDDVEVD